MDGENPSSGARTSQKLIHLFLKRDDDFRLFGFLFHRFIVPGAPFAELLHHLFLCSPAQAENQERVFVEAFAQNVMRGGDMFAWVGRIRARTIRFQIPAR